MGMGCGTRLKLLMERIHRAPVVDEEKNGGDFDQQMHSWSQEIASAFLSSDCRFFKSTNGRFARNGA